MRMRTGEPNRHPIWLPALRPADNLDPHLRLGSTCLAQTQPVGSQQLAASSQFW
jgi:hypothetical protein